MLGTGFPPRSLNVGCIGVHTDRAINAGATREEVAEALGVAVALECHQRKNRNLPTA
jgi:hypothetical protein